MKFAVITPMECNPTQLRAFYDLVISGGQVAAASLEERIKASDFLAFCEVNNQIVGVASIKNPNPKYKKKVFRKAKAENEAKDYDYEIGYAVTLNANRGNGISQHLIKLLMDRSKSMSFYATTKADEMRHILAKIGFTQLGNDYKNDNDEVLTLYCKSR